MLNGRSIESINILNYLLELDPQFISSVPHLPTCQNPTFPVADLWAGTCRRWDFDRQSQEDPHLGKLYMEFPLERRDLNMEDVLEGWYFLLQSQTSVAFSFSRFLESFSSGWCWFPSPRFWVSAGIYGALTHTQRCCCGCRDLRTLTLQAPVSKNT